MSDLKKLYKELEKYKNFEDNDNDEKFLKIIDRIVAFKNPNSLSVLVKYFNDQEANWVLESLAGTLIDYLDEIDYTKEVLKNIHLMLPDAQEFLLELFYPIINESKCLEILKDNLHLARKEQLIVLLNKIYEESERHRPIVSELKELLNKCEK